VHIEQRIKELGYDLPVFPPPPRGAYCLAVRNGNTMYISGHIPQTPDGELLTGRLGENMTLEEGQAAAELIALNMCSTMREELGDLDKVKHVLRLTGFVNSAADFTLQHKVVDGASNFFWKVFGDKGVHARSAYGTSTLPLGIPVEIEAIVLIED